jgi:hypothetical protein
MAQEISLTATSSLFPLPHCFPPVIWPCWCWSSASLSYNSGAPAIHPTSSCSSAWRWVLHCPSFLQLWRGPCGDLELFLVVVGPLCLFLIVIGARCHPLALPNLQAGACSGGNGWWVGTVTLGGGVEHVSVTWHAYGGCWVLTRWVSPFWGLSVSLCALLAHVDSLTSHLNGEEEVLVAMGVHCAFFIIAGHHQ